MKTLLRGAAVAAPLLALGTLAPTAVAGQAQADGIAGLTVAQESHSDSYDRDAFGDYDREALLTQNFAAFADCDGYFSRYDDKCYELGDRTKEEVDDNVDVDHTVALKEAWESGAWQWSEAKRDRFASDTANLTLLTSAVNRGDKSARDAAGWRPDVRTCQYVGVVVSVKSKYGLAIDEAEKQALLDAAASCAGNDGDDGDGGNNGGSQGGDNQDSQPEDVDCSAFDYQEQAQVRFEAHEEDIFSLDRDSDGKACESLPHKPGEDEDTQGSGSEEDGTGDGTDSNEQVSQIPEGGVQTGGGAMAEFVRRSQLSRS